MNCLEFKRLALADPISTDVSFIEHSETCVDCLKFAGELQQMDTDLANSLEVKVPDDLVAKLHLANEMNEANHNRSISRYAIAASFAAALFVAGFLVSNQLGPKPGEVTQDYEKLLSAVVDHVNYTPLTPVWESARANTTVGTLLASYDQSLKLDPMNNLKFGRICPMGKYRGLHATLDSPNGPTTFAYIKGEPVGELLNANYEGYVTQVKPVRGGNLVIVSRNQASLDQASAELENAMHWDI